MNHTFIKKLSVLLASVFVFSSFQVSLAKEDNTETNYRTDFSLDSNKAEAGKWCYLDGSGLIVDDAIGKVNYLQKFNDSVFKENEYARTNRPERVWFVRSDGAWASDNLPLAACFTITADYANAAGGINFKGTMSNGRLIIAKTSDKNSSEIKGAVEILYDESKSHNYDFTVEKGKFSVGDDVIFLFQRTVEAEIWWVEQSIDMTIKAMNVPQVETPVLSPEISMIPYNGKVTLTTATPDAEIYYTTDGTDPNGSDTRILYTEPFPLTEHTDVKVCASKDGMETSYTNYKRYVIDFPINEFMGSCIDVPKSHIDGFKYTRTDFPYGAQLAPGVYDDEQIKGYGDNILRYREQGVTLIPVIYPAASFLLETDGYKFTHRLTGEVYEYGPASEETDWLGTLRVWDKWGNLTTERDYRLGGGRYQVSEEAAQHIEDYFKHIVEILSAPPYNQEYFQVHNEAYPSSGFYYGDLDAYFQRVHIPAARGIKAAGGKVVFGGWPCCGPMNELVDLLDRNDAWDTIDIFDIHYHPLASMDYLYRAAKERGIENPKIWQTEMGFSSWSYYPTNMYPRTLRWALDKGFAEDPEVAKLIWYSAWSPDDPNAYGYQSTIMSSDHLSTCGVSIKNFTTIMSGTDLKAYNNFKTTPELKPEIEEMVSSAEGFMTDGNRAIVALHLVKNNSFCTLMSDINGNGKTIDLNNPKTRVYVDFYGVTGNVTATRIDILGNRTSLETEVLEDGGVRVYVPTLDEDEYVKDLNLSNMVNGIYVELIADSIEDGALNAPAY